MSGLQSVVQKIADRRSVLKPPPPAVSDSQLALRLNEQWRSEIAKRVRQLAGASRIARRSAWLHPEQRSIALENRAASIAYLAAARIVKGLL